MKKIFYLILWLTPFCSHAQFEKGKYFVGFDFSENYLIPERKNMNGVWSSILGIPTAGYFLRENMLIGLNTGFHIPPKSIRVLVDDLGLVASLSPFFRLYKKTTSRAVPFVQLSPEFGTRLGASRFEFTNANGQNIGSYQAKECQLGAQLNAGVTFKLTKRVLFDLSLYVDKVYSTYYMSTKGSVINNPATNAKAHDSYSNAGITGGLKILL